MNELILKYRPETWDQVIGQDAVVRSIQSALKGKKARAFLLTGPSGTGKTTLSRLIAKTLGADMAYGGYIELDGATNSGIDDARELKTRIQVRPLNGSVRVICVDECHQLTKPAWNALLKAVEEPPDGVYWCFCTSESEKVIQTIRTRCLEYKLRPVDSETLQTFLKKIAEAEGIRLIEGAEDLILKVAEGSPRAALAALLKASSAKSLDELSLTLESISADGSPQIIDLCRALYKGSSRDKLLAIVADIEGYSAETVRNIVCSYFTKVALNPKAPSFESALAILVAFGTPYPQSNTLYPVIISIANLFADNGDA